MHKILFALVQVRIFLKEMFIKTNGSEDDGAFGGVPLVIIKPAPFYSFYFMGGIRYLNI